VCQALILLIVAVLSGCTTLAPGTNFSKSTSVALAHPEETRLGAQFALAAREHGGNSAFRIITVGVDGFLTRMQMINAAERTLDLQYYIFRGDETGRLLTDALLRAANRGVRVRVLVDDGGAIAGDEQINAVDPHPQIEVRIFNPFAYRGYFKPLRAIEFIFNSARLDYRMHNKLLIADNTLALIGGRNIGNEYFQMDPESQLADDDIFAAGPIVNELSVTFDDYWQNRFSIPAEALTKGEHSATVIAEHRARELEGPREQLQTLQTDGIDYVTMVATGEPYAGMISGRLPLVWAHAQVVCDSPDKKLVGEGGLRGQIMLRPVADAARAVQSELLIITPYFIPADEEFQLIKDLRERQVRVRILTNSLESAPELIAHSGYLHYRVPLLNHGVELFEVRSLLGNARGSGQTVALSRYGNYALHAKFFVFDRRQLFIGSLNFDQRSKYLNTEVGLIIDSPELAQQTALRFEGMAERANSYALALLPPRTGARPTLMWKTQEDGKPMIYLDEPARHFWDRFTVTFFSLLPIASEL
jgi:cardiolipin synthase C